MRAILLLALAGCSAEVEDYLVFDYVGDGEHVVRPRTIDTLSDPVRLQGDLGDGTRGGTISYDVDDDGDLRNVTFNDGSPLHIEHAVLDGTFVPVDDQGLVLLSFYSHLERTRDDLTELGHGDVMDAIFPMRAISWAPDIEEGALFAVENAAYLSRGLHTFVLYPEANNTMPLTANLAVVRHELAHAWFAELFPGHVSLTPPRDLVVVDDVAALNEGFADMVATLSLDAPGALPIPGRDPSRDKDVSTADPRVDPYSLGVVLAAFAWDVRTLTDDAALTLQIVLDALQRWDAGVQAGTLEPESVTWGSSMFEAAAAVLQDTTGLCEAYQARFLAAHPDCAS